VRFGNGPEKGNGKQRIVGKSIADHMRDAIAQGKSVYAATAYVRAQCSCARCPNKRMHELYASLLPNVRLRRRGQVRAKRVLVPGRL
jgi:hypothetical protein